MSDKYNSSYTGAEIDEAVGHALNLGGSGNAAPQSSVTPVETSPSTHGYTVGKLLTYNGQLYRVIASISIGDTLTVNTNIAATTIADEIDGIVTDISTSTPTNINGVLAGDGTHVVSKQIVESRTITKQDYDNLSAADKAKDILYHITDDDPSQLTFDNVPTAGSDNPVKSGGIKSALDAKADKNDLATIHQTSPTCTETNGIAAGVFFYLDNELVVAKTAIANGATFTNGTNYESPTAGGLNALKSAFTKHDFDSPVSIIDYTSASNAYEIPDDGYIVAYASATGPAFVSVIITGPSGSNSINVSAINPITVNSWVTNTVFVRKGMKAYVASYNGTYLVRYYKLI